MTDRTALAARFRHAASVWKGTCLAKVDVSAEVCDLDVIADALSASAGPQADVDIEELADVAESVLLPEIQRLRDALKNMMGVYDTPLSRRRFPPDAFMQVALESGRAALAHPQPHQADGRGAVIEECAAIARDHTPAKHDGTLAAHVVGLTIEKAIRALQQSDGPAK